MRHRKGKKEQQSNAYNLCRPWHSILYSINLAGKYYSIVSRESKLAPWPVFFSLISCAGSFHYRCVQLHGNCRPPSPWQPPRPPDWSRSDGDSCHWLLPRQHDRWRCWARRNVHHSDPPGVTPTDVLHSEYQQHSFGDQECVSQSQWLIPVCFGAMWQF